VYADKRTQPVLTTEVTSLDIGAPDSKTLRFRAPAGVRIDHSRALDEAAGANAFAVSLEPRGGSATGQPTGPVLCSGVIAPYSRPRTAA